MSIVEKEGVLPGKAWLDRSPEGKSQRLLIACVGGDDSYGGASTPSTRKVSWVEVRSVKPEGKKEMGVRDWWNGWPAAERKQGWAQLGEEEYSVPQ